MGRRLDRRGTSVTGGEGGGRQNDGGRGEVLPSVTGEVVRVKRRRDPRVGAPTAKWSQVTLGRRQRLTPGQGGGL